MRTVFLLSPEFSIDKFDDRVVVCTQREHLATKRREKKICFFTRLIMRMLLIGRQTNWHPATHRLLTHVLRIDNVVRATWSHIRAHITTLWDIRFSSSSVWSSTFSHKSKQLNCMRLHDYANFVFWFGRAPNSWRFFLRRSLVDVDRISQL